MNLAQMKVALEQSVQDALKQSLDAEIAVNTAYDADNGVMLIELRKEFEKKDNHSNILCYNIQFVEESKELNIVAFNRAYIYDGLGVAIVNNEPVTISNIFMQDMSQIIEFGMDRGYHPEKYQPTEESDKQATEDVIDGNAE